MTTAKTHDDEIGRAKKLCKEAKAGYRNLCTRVQRGDTTFSSLSGGELLQMKIILAQLKESAYLGNAEAAHILGTLFFEKGGPMQRDERAAVFWWKVAAGELSQADDFAETIRRPKPYVTPLFVPSFGNHHSGMGHPQSMTSLACCYEYGYGGLMKDMTQATRLYKAAAMRGDDNAHCALARLHRKGRDFCDDDHRLFKAALVHSERQRPKRKRNTGARTHLPILIRDQRREKLAELWQCPKNQHRQVFPVVKSAFTY